MKSLIKMFVGPLITLLFCSLLLGVDTNRGFETSGYAAAPDNLKSTAESSSKVADSLSYPLPPEVLKRLSPEDINEIIAHRQRIWEREGIVTQISLFSFLIIVVPITVGIRFRRHKILHETLRLMIEKGTPIPSELLQPPTVQPGTDLRVGLVLECIGMPLLIWLLGQPGREWVLALIPSLMGAAFLVVWKLPRNSNRPATK